MPSIEITAEQAQRLASGENITIAAPKHLLAISSMGAIYEIFDAVQRGTTWYGAWTVIRYPSGRIGNGVCVARGGFPLASYEFTEVTR